MFQQTHLNNKSAYHTYPSTLLQVYLNVLMSALMQQRKSLLFNLRTCGEYGVYALEPPLTTEA